MEQILNSITIVAKIVYLFHNIEYSRLYNTYEGREIQIPTLTGTPTL